MIQKALEFLIYAPLWQLHAALLIGGLAVMLWFFRNYETKRKSWKYVDRRSTAMAQG